MTYNPFSLSGKTVLITGAASGIGRATAIECCRMGAEVIITDINPDGLEETFRAIAGAKRDTYPNCRRSDQEEETSRWPIVYPDWMVVSIMQG